MGGNSVIYIVISGLFLSLFSFLYLSCLSTSSNQQRPVIPQSNPAARQCKCEAKEEKKKKERKKASEKVGVCLSTRSLQVHILSVNIKD